MLRTTIVICLVFVVLTCFASGPSLAAGRDLTLVPKASPMSGERRLALVIGNAAYSGDGVHPLKNPINDANAMAKALQRVGFNVREVCDVDRDEIRDAVHDFVDDIRQSPDNVVALLYYSGHGMQVDGKNYLIPIGFTMPEHADDVPDNAYDMQKALDEMQAANARVNIVILDACRSNPYDTSRAVGGKGLGKMEASGVYIAYATAEGQTADDNPASSNGLYTESLLKALQTPGLDIHQVFQTARRNVWDASDHTQYPYDYDGLLSDDFYFAGNASGSTDQPESTPSDSTKSTAADSFERAKALLTDGKYSDAELLLRDAVREDPENPSYLDALGGSLFQQKKYSEAESFTRKAAQLDSGDAMYQRDLGNVVAAQGKYADAEPYLREAVRLGPDIALCQYYLAFDLYNEKEYVDAEPHFRRAVELDPSNANYQDRLGEDLSWQDKFSDSEACYRKAVRLDSKNAIYQDDLGNALYAQQRYSDAEPYYEEAVHLDGSNTTYKSDLNNCRRKLGQNGFAYPGE